MRERTYKPDEIKKLLERALELQADSLSRGEEAGLSLGELEEVARASGIDPALVAQAAAELEAPSVAVTAPTSTHVFAERVVMAELTDDLWADLLTELRGRFESGEDSGIEERHGSTRSWRHADDEDLHTQVHVTPRDGRLHIRLSRAVASSDTVVESLVWSGISTLILGTLAAGTVDGTLLTVLAYILVFVISFPVVYAIDRYWRGSKQRDLERAADALARLAGTPAQATASTAIHARTAASGTAEPRTDLEDLGETGSSERPAGEQTGLRTRS